MQARTLALPTKERAPVIFIIRCDQPVMAVYLKMPTGGKGSVVSALV
jgi:hypothetical protein